MRDISVVVVRTKAAVQWNQRLVLQRGSREEKELQRESKHSMIRRGGSRNLSRQNGTVWHRVYIRVVLV